MNSVHTNLDSNRCSHDAESGTLSNGNARRACRGPAAPSSANWREGFTLIELLTVLAIILIAISLVLGGLAQVRNIVKARIASNDCRQIMLGCQSFYTAYGIWPYTGIVTRADTFMVTPHFITMMTRGGSGGQWDPARKLAPNPNRNVFMQIRMEELDAAGNLADPWGNPYLMRFDITMTNSIPDPFNPGEEIRASVIVWSAGKDGQMSTNSPINPAVNRDNITSWRG